MAGRFVTYAPDPKLRPYLKYIAVSESESSASYKVLPSSGLVAGFQFRGRLAIVRDEYEDILATAGITGLQDKARVFRNTPGIGTVLVGFTETGAAALLDLPVHALFAQSVSLEHFVKQSELDGLGERLDRALNDEQRIRAVQDFLWARLQPSPDDALVSEAVRLIEESDGKIRIAQLQEILNISASPLEKRFRARVGASPKKFASIIRFNRALESLKNGGTFRWMEDAGYFDQAHFIRDFQRFTGSTPEQFRSESGK